MRARRPYVLSNSFFSSVYIGEAAWAVEMYAPAHLHATAAPLPTSARKRGAASDDADEDQSGAMMQETESAHDFTRKKSGGSGGGGDVEAGAEIANFALPKYAGTSSAIVNVYHDGESLKLFDTVEFFGVLAVASLDSTINSGCDDDGFNMAPPPASAVPRFHALTYRRLKTTHPLTSGCMCSTAPHVPASAVPSIAAAAKAAFVDCLRAALACDADCASLVLLCIMSNIQERVAGEAIGSYSLNLRMPPTSTCGAPRSRWDWGCFVDYGQAERCSF